MLGHFYEFFFSSDDIFGDFESAAPAPAAPTPQTPAEPAAPAKKTNADILSLFNSAPAPQANNQFGGFQQNNMFGGFGGAPAMQQAPPTQQSTGSNLDILGTT